MTEDTNASVLPGQLFLIDSGAQYEDGTTDITRTLPVGDVGEEEKTAFTQVLRGMIAIHRARFPKGVAGAHLDALARAPLWSAGRDFDHGTGHGVGVYLSVHEGPQRLSRASTVPLEPGMILSNEPGYLPRRRLRHPHREPRRCGRRAAPARGRCTRHAMLRDIDMGAH